MRNVFPLLLGLVLLASCSQTTSSLETSSSFQPESSTSVSVEPKTIEYSGDGSFFKHQSYRTIITTDGEMDDENSWIHALLYANELNLKGVVYTASDYHYSGDESHDSFRWYGFGWVEDYIDAYGEVLDNLRQYDSNYPSVEYLKSITKHGNTSYRADMSEETEGSNLIKEEILKDEDSLLYLLAWGGMNTIGRALKSIEEEHSSDSDWTTLKSKIVSKVRINSISVQDNIYDNYISKNWPDLTVYQNKDQYALYGFSWRSGKDTSTFKSAWQSEHVLHQDNPLLKLYHSHLDGVAYPNEIESFQFGLDLDDNPDDGKHTTSYGKFERYDFISEGDSPSFLMLLDNGLSGCEIDKTASWGGYYQTESG